MIKLLLTTCFLLVTTQLSFANAVGAKNHTAPASAKKRVSVLIKTSMGDIEAELYADKAPKTVSNFLKYAQQGFYKGTIFHRVIDNFMIQGGGFTKEMNKKQTKAPVRNEARSDLPNEPGTLAMARTSDVHSATSQFFINVNDNSFLNHKNKSQSGYGYAVFGKVKKGMSVVNRIKQVKTKAMQRYRDVPVEPIVIKDVVIQSDKI